MSPRRTILLCAALFTLSACDLLKQNRPIAEEVWDAQQEFRTLYSVPVHILTHVDQTDGDEAIDVRVQFDRLPQGLVANEVRANANIIVRKHIRKVRDVAVIFDR